MLQLFLRICLSCSGDYFKGLMLQLRSHIGMAATKATNCFNFVIKVSVLTLLNVLDGAIYIVARS